MANKLTTNQNLRLAACTIAPDGNAAASGAITWRIKGIADGAYGNDFFTSVATSGGNIVLNYPAVSKVHSFMVTLGAKSAQRAIFTEASAGLSSATIVLYQQAGVYAGHLRGTAGGTSWTENGDLSLFADTLNNASRYDFNPPKPSNSGSDNQNLNYWKSIAVNYEGSTLDRRVERVLSGLTGVANFGVREVVASTGAAIGANSTADVISIFTTTHRPLSVPCNVNNSTGWPGANILTNDFELDVVAYLEL